MTNSETGVDVFSKIKWAIEYLMRWPEIALPSGMPAPTAAFETVGRQVPSAWRGYLGTWEDWEIQEKGDGSPSVKFRQLPSVRLVLAAKPDNLRANNESIDCVVKGLEMMLRFTTKAGEKVIEVWSGLRADVTELHRS